MKPPPFDYVRPGSVEEALAVLAGDRDAKLLAGGQSLIPAMNFRLAAPTLLVDLGGLGELVGIRETEDGGLAIGAMTRQRDVERSALVRERSPLVAEVMPWIAHPQIRNRGTIGGSLAHADPAAELPAVMLALGATFVARGAEGERRIPAAEFYVGLFATALEPGEMLVRVVIPAPAPGTRFAFEEVSRRHGDFALAGVAVSCTPGADGSVADAAICLLSVGDGPISAVAGAAALRGAPLSEATIAAAAEATAGELDPPGDIHATPAYRRHLAGVLTRRALERARRT
jgi:carbon-monoxide dehydrogenase medium subunit